MVKNNIILIHRQGHRDPEKYSYLAVVTFGPVSELSVRHCSALKLSVMAGKIGEEIDIVCLPKTPFSSVLNSCSIFLLESIILFSVGDTPVTPKPLLLHLGTCGLALPEDDTLPGDTALENTT